MSYRDFIIHLLFYTLGFAVSALIIRAAKANGFDNLKIFPFIIGILIATLCILGLIDLIYNVLKKD